MWKLIFLYFLLLGSASQSKSKIDYQTAFYVVLGLYLFSILLLILSWCVNYISGESSKDEEENITDAIVEIGESNPPKVSFILDSV